MRLAERANVFSKRARDERAGHPIGDGGWPPDRGSPGCARTARTGPGRTMPRCRRGSAGARQAGQSDSDGAVRRDSHGGRATLPRPVHRDARGRAVRARGPVAYLLMSHGHLADGLQSLARGAVTAGDWIQIGLDIGLDTASVVFHLCDRTFESSPQAVEYLSMAILRALRRGYP